MRRQACGLCRVPGHNRRTCPAPDAAPLHMVDAVPLRPFELEDLRQISGAGA